MVGKNSKDAHVQDEVKEGEDVRIYERRRRRRHGKERALGSFGTCMMRACGVPTFRLHGTETLRSASEWKASKALGVGGNGSM